jgi:Domain of unknown function (DUF6378)
MSAEFRQKILADAAAVVSKDRNSAYGEPEDHFRHIAALWNAYLDTKTLSDPNEPIQPEDVALMMILLKVARLSNNFDQYDSSLDIAGYAACLADIATPDIHAPLPT